MKYSNTRTTQYNKMPNYITNPNLRLLTQKLQEEVEGLDQNAPVFPKTLNKHITACVERKTYKKQAKSTFSSLHFHMIPTLVPIFYFHRFQSLFRKTSSILVLSVSAVRALTYVANGIIKIIIKNFILSLKNATSASKL